MHQRCQATVTETTVTLGLSNDDLKRSFVDECRRLSLPDLLCPSRTWFAHAIPCHKGLLNWNGESMKIGLIHGKGLKAIPISKILFKIFKLLGTPALTIKSQ